MKTSKINIPIILEFRDYHDIDFFGSDLQRIIPLIRWKEIDFDRGNYLAIYYFNIKEANEFLLNNKYNRQIEGGDMIPVVSPPILKLDNKTIKEIRKKEK